MTQDTYTSLLPQSGEEAADYQARMAQTLRATSGAVRRSVVMACNAVGTAWDKLGMENPFTTPALDNPTTTQEALQTGASLMADKIKGLVEKLDTADRLSAEGSIDSRTVAQFGHTVSNKKIQGALKAATNVVKQKFTNDMLKEVNVVFEAMAADLNALEITESSAEAGFKTAFDAIKRDFKKLRSAALEKGKK